VDRFDYAIYRYLSPDGFIRFWGARRSIDPRVSVREIAEKVGLSEAGTRVRLKSLKERGILHGSETWLNPSVFGASLVVVEVPVREASEAKQLLQELSLVDGVTFARDILDEQDRKVRVHYISDNVSSTARRTSLIRRLSPTGALRGPTPYWIPACSRNLSPLDWRLLEAFRSRPDSTLARFAKEVGVSLKTTASRFHALLDSYACWWTPDGESEEMPLALLSISIQEGGDRPGVAREVAQQNPSWMPVAPDGFGVPPATPNSPLVGLVPAEGPAAVERTVHNSSGIQGVVNVRRTFALGSAGYSQWYDEGLARKVRSPS
jgi:DNA-binding Lrp family transcriptional regulator